MKYKTFIFDFDYTLADATPGIVECVNYALNKAGLKPADDNNIKKHVGKTLNDIFFELTGVKDDTAAVSFVSDFIFMAAKVMTENTILLNDTIDILSKLKLNGCNTAIVSTKLRRRIEEALEKYNITNLIDFVIGLEDVASAKPSPEGLLKSVDYFGNNKDSVLYIGDSLIDANTAANAFVDFAAVTTGTTKKEDFLKLPHVFIAKNLTELFEHVSDMK